MQIHNLEKERLEYEQTLSKLKEKLNSLKQEIVDLNGKLDEKRNVELQLERCACLLLPHTCLSFPRFHLLLKKL